MTVYLELLFAMALAKDLLHVLAYLAGRCWDRLPIAWIANVERSRRTTYSGPFTGRLSPSAIDALGRSTFINLGRTVVETCAFHSA